MFLQPLVIIKIGFFPITSKVSVDSGVSFNDTWRRDTVGLDETLDRPKVVVVWSIEILSPFSSDWSSIERERGAREESCLTILVKDSKAKTEGRESQAVQIKILHKSLGLNFHLGFGLWA